MVLLGLIKNAFMFDCKDTLSETIRRQNSSKMHASAYRWINFISNAGLLFEHSCAYFARASEELLVQLHGLYDNEKAPVDEWKDYAKKNPKREILMYWTGLDDIVSPEEASKIIESDKSQEQQEEESRDEQGEGRCNHDGRESRDDSGDANHHDSGDVNHDDTGNGDCFAGFDEWFSK